MMDYWFSNSLFIGLRIIFPQEISSTGLLYAFKYFPISFFFWPALGFSPTFEILFLDIQQLLVFHFSISFVYLWFILNIIFLANGNLPVI